MHESYIMCEICGRTVPIISSVELYQDVQEIADAETGSLVPDVSCRIACPTCGVRIQTIDTHPGAHCRMRK